MLNLSISQKIVFLASSLFWLVLGLWLEFNFTFLIYFSVVFWIIFMFEAFICGNSKKSVVIAQDDFSFLLHLIVIASTSTLINVKGEFFPAPRLAFVFLFLAALFALWGRFALGSNWSFRPEIKRGHKLVTTGPYAFVRHPMYTGLSFMGIGLAMISGSIIAYLSALAMITVLALRIGIEERLLEKQFGDEYRQYQLKTKRLIPFLF
jgi:protein-S-isoprenylcysteine O-methyltransferase Ste14